MTRWIAPTFIALSCMGMLAACTDPQAPQPVAPTVGTAPPPAPTPTPTPSELPRGAEAAATAKDSPATDPKGALSKEEESKSMPMAAHGNNHSSPSLEPPAKK